MIDFPVTPKKKEALRRRMEALGLSEEQLQEDFILGAGKGGQKKNKSSTAVRLVHKESGTEVKTGKHRLQALNRYEARKLMCERLEEQAGLSKKDDKAAKIRKQKARRKRRSSSKQ